jgi:hypothetical protein
VEQEVGVRYASRAQKMGTACEENGPEDQVFDGRSQKESTSLLLLLGLKET